MGSRDASVKYTRELYIPPPAARRVAKGTDVQGGWGRKAHALLPTGADDVTHIVASAAGAQNFPPALFRGAATHASFILDS